MNTPTSTVNKFQHMNKGSLKIFYTNADSLPNKFTELQAHVQTTTPHIVGVCEVKPKNSRYDLNEPEIELPGYNMYNSDLKKGRHRGCVLYISNKLSATQVEENMQDQVWVEVKVSGNDILLIGIVYRSPGISNKDHQEVLNSVRNQCTKKSYSHILLMGDFNFPTINWKYWTTNSDDPENQANKFIECIRDCFLHQHVTSPTRIRQNNQPNLLDLIFTNEATMVENLRPLSPLGKSDHIMIEFDFRCYAERIQKESVPRYNLDRGDYDGMRQELENGWDQIEEIDTIDGKWEYMRNRIQLAAEKFIPKKREGCGKRGGIPLSRELRKLIRKKNTSWQRYMETKNTDDRDEGNNKFRQYRKIRNRVRKMTRKAED